MRLEALLAGLSAEDRRYLEETAGGPSSKDGLAAVLSVLKPWTVEVLKVMVCRFGSAAFEGEMLERSALERGISGAHVRASLLILRRRGICFALRKGWGEELLVLPEDTLPLWLDLLLPSPLHAADPAQWQNGELLGEKGCAAYDVLHLLQLTDAGHMKLTRQGKLAKSAWKKLTEGLIASGEDLLPCGIAETGEGSGYGPAAALVLQMAINCGLVYSGGEGLHLQGKQTADWLKSPTGSVSSRLYHCWRSALPDSESWMELALISLEKAQPNRWYMLAPLFEWLRDCGMMGRIAADVLQQIFLETRLLPMQALGWISLCRLEDGLAFSLSAVSHIDHGRYACLIVQPDLELIVPPTPPLFLVWELMAWCEPVSKGELAVYRITRERVRNAAARGLDAAQFLRLLEEYSQIPVDDKLKTWVMEWCEPFAARCGLTAVDLLPESHPASKDGKIPEDTIVLSGFHSGSGVKPALYGLPLADSRAEALRDIPPAWRQKAAAYHPSTQKQLISKAIECKASLALIHSDNFRQVVPLSLRETHEGWKLEAMAGGSRVMLKPEDWSEIQLVLPEIYG